MADPTAAQLKIFAKTGVAMPDESYYVRNADDLHNAILAVGRAAPSNDQTEVQRRNAVRRHIINRAKVLNLSSQIPDTWNSDGSLKHSQAEEFLAHLGVRGSVWGIRHQRALDRHMRVLSGVGTPQDQTHVRLEMDQFTMRHYKGSLRAYSADEAAKLKQQKERSVPGHAVDMPVNDFLQHFGRKGMKWGEHVFETNNSGSGSTRKEARADKKFTKAAASPAIHVSVWNHSAQKMNEVELPRINAKYEGKNPLDNPKYRDAYMKEVSDAALKSLQDSADAFGGSKSGNLHLVIEPRNGGPGEAGINGYVVRAHAIQHADTGDEDPIVAVVVITKNTQGLVGSVVIHSADSDSLSQSYEELGKNFLQHFGRKGMKWGEHVFGGGRDTTSHISDDAARSEAIRAKIQKHGVSSLSNAELQHHVQRLNLEQQHARLTATPSNVKKGHEIVKGILGGAKTGLDAYNTGVQGYKTVKEIQKAVSK